MKQDEIKKLIIEQLEKSPILEIALNKSGISRRTFYRYQKDDHEFAKLVHEAMHDSKSLVSDVAIGQLISAVKRGNLSALMFWLKNNHDDYRAKLEITGELKHIREEMTQEEVELLNEALKLAGFSNEQPVAENTDGKS